MYEFLNSTHSILRYALLFFLLVTAFRSLFAWIGGGHYKSWDRNFALGTVIFTHLQLLIGLVLYFMSPKVRFEKMGEVMKNDMLRFFTVEHITMMLLAVVLITIGNSRAKKARNDVARHRVIAIFFLIALVLILLGIPWPYREFQDAWI